jgi:hypothetical protein
LHHVADVTEVDFDVEKEEKTLDGHSFYRD